MFPLSISKFHMNGLSIRHLSTLMIHVYVSSAGHVSVPHTSLTITVPYQTHRFTVRIEIAASRLETKYRQLMEQLIYLNLPYGRIMAYFSLLADKISITTSLENVDTGLEPN
jgi:hypothetical protein